MRSGALISLLFVASCELSGFPPVATRDAAQGANDAGGGMDGTVVDAPPDDAVAAMCDQPILTSNDGHHNPGQDCYSNCHDGTMLGAGAPTYYIAGTLYQDTGGAVPVPGATLHVTDVTGKRVTMLTTLNGNFYTTQTVTFPVDVWFGRCPNIAHMPDDVMTPGSCNRAGCHDTGANRIHIP